MSPVPHPIDDFRPLSPGSGESPPVPPISPPVAAVAPPAQAAEAEVRPPLVLPVPPPVPEPPLTAPPPLPPPPAAPPIAWEAVAPAAPAAQPRGRIDRLRPRRGTHEQLRIVGLKIDSSELAAAQVGNDGVPELLRVARRPLAPGIVVEGELRDPGALTAALKALFKSSGLPRRGVRIGIASSRVAVRVLEVAGADDPQQLGNAVRFRAQELLPIPLDEMAIDHRVLAERPGADGRTVRRVLVVATYRELVDGYAAACRRAGLGLIGVDIEAFAVLRALAAPLPRLPGEQGAALVAVAVGHDRTSLAVSDGRVCELARVLEWGGSTLDAAVAQTLGVPVAQAEPLRRALGLGGSSGVPGGMSAEAATVAREAMRRAVYSLARELVSSLEFYQARPGSLAIGEIVISGGASHTPGLAAELAALIGVGVRVGDPLARVRVAEGLDEPGQIGSFAVAIGLGIED